MKDLCQICNKNEKEIYQLDLEVCYDCWMDETNPKISSWFVTLYWINNLVRRRSKSRFD